MQVMCSGGDFFSFQKHCTYIKISAMGKIQRNTQYYPMNCQHAMATMPVYWSLIHLMKRPDKQLVRNESYLRVQGLEQKYMKFVRTGFEYGKN